MYVCVILSLSRLIKFFFGKNLDDVGKSYWKHKRQVFQILLTKQNNT